MIDREGGAFASSYIRPCALRGADDVRCSQGCSRAVGVKDRYDLRVRFPACNTGRRPIERFEELGPWRIRGSYFHTVQVATTNRLYTRHGSLSSGLAIGSVWRFAQRSLDSR